MHRLFEFGARAAGGRPRASRVPPALPPIPPSAIRCPCPPIRHPCLPCRCPTMPPSHAAAITAHAADTATHAPDIPPAHPPTIRLCPSRCCGQASRVRSGAELAGTPPPPPSRAVGHRDHLQRLRQTSGSKHAHARWRWGCGCRLGDQVLDLLHLKRVGQHDQRIRAFIGDDFNRARPAAVSPPYPPPYTGIGRGNPGGRSWRCCCRSRP